MGRKEKLIKKLKTIPKDFTFDEMCTLLSLLGFITSNKGKSSGSRVKFSKGDIPIQLHRPHPEKELHEYQLKQIIDILEGEDLI